MRLDTYTSIGCLLVINSLATLIGTIMCFKEIPQESRKTFFELKEAENKQQKKD